MLKLKLALIFSVALTCTAYAENWPNWRGPASTGVSQEKGLPVTWSSSENVAWKASIRGFGISSPIVWGNRVFVTSQVGTNLSRPGPRLFQQGDAAAAGERPLGTAPSAAASGTTFLITAFDTANGRKVWEHELQAEGELPSVHEKHNAATPSPATDGQRVYAVFGTGQIAAVGMDGKLAWKRNLATEYGKFDIMWGTGTSPIVYKDTVILLNYHPGSAYLLAMDARTGTNRWKADGKKGAFSYSTPFIIETPASAEMIVNWSEGLSGHNPANGELLWHIEESNRFPIPVPSQHEGVIYASRGYRSGPFMAIRPGGKGDIAKSHVIWKVDTGAPYVSSLIHYEGLIYMMGDVGVATATDAKTGERVWQERIGGVYSASPVAADGKIYFLSESGDTIVLAAGRTPRVLAQNKLEARQLGSPAISGGRLFIRSDDALYAIGK